VRSFADYDQWQLYNVNADFNERIDLAKKNPKELKEHNQVLKNHKKEA
jgi:hypothetical protein